jgi:hypothetical protein
MALPRMFHGAPKSVEPPTAPPRQGLVDALLRHSGGLTYEEARREWVFDGTTITADDEKFLEHCPCGAKLEVVNYLLTHSSNGKAIILGSECIKRFVLLNGAETQEDSRKVFERIIKAKKRDADLVTMWPRLLVPRVSSHTMQAFRDRADDFLGSLEANRIPAERWHELLMLLKVGETDRHELTRLKDILFRPNRVPKEDKVIQLGARSEEEIRQEIGVWRKTSRAPAVSTLGDSEIYHPESFVERKERRQRK